MKFLTTSNLSSAITETTQTAAHKRSSNTARARKRRETRSTPITFICVDGEGVTLKDGTHRYVLLGVGDQQITNPDGLSFLECVEFLWEQFQSYGTRGIAYTGFFLGYDFIQMLKTLPEERARMLLTQAGRDKRKRKTSKRPDPFPVEYQGWEFDILGMKRLKIRKQGTSRWMSICDTGGFFQKSFLKVIDPKEWSDPVVTTQEFDTVVQGKSKRATAILDGDMLRYNALENAILARVLGRLDEGFRELGIQLKPNQWFGPGQAASAWLDGRAITAPDLQEITPIPVLEAARASYFGGWFEIMAHGHIPGITWEYDINSAYPYIISSLPCLEHGSWMNAESSPEDSALTIVRASVTGSDPYIGAMLHRDKDGNIYRPHRTEGWYWLDEIMAAKRAGIIDSVETIDSWTYTPCECPPPLREVRDIYALRRKVGKKTPLGIACKLVPNSLYGKFAQSIGSPKFGNAIYASRITSGTRTMILNAIATHPKGTEDVVMVATDGVYFRSPHPNLPVSGKLGDWDSEEKSNMCLFKPGVYWDDKARQAIRNGDLPVFKARGVNARDFSREIKKIDMMFRKARGCLEVLGVCPWPKVQFPLAFSMITASQALQRNDWSLAGTLIDAPTVMQSSQPGIKRRNAYHTGTVYKAGGVKIHGIIRSEPRPNEPYEASYPYLKRFGMEDPFSDLAREANGVSQEGLTGNTIMETLGFR